MKLRITKSLLFLCFIVLVGTVSVVMAAPIPTVTLDVPPNVLVGDTFTFSVTFENTGTDTGYGPFIDLYIPYNGADGGDGIDVTSITYEGITLTTQQFVFPASGCIDHPYLQDTALNPVQVCGTPGDMLIVVELPFGSVTPNFPAITVDVEATVSSFADPGVPLNIDAQGGFQFGANPIDDPCCDVPVLSSVVSAPVTPSIFTITKTNNLSENETVTGPNFPGTWTITVDIADGETLDGLVITDYLPDNVIITGITAPGAIFSTPLPATSPLTTPLEITYPAGAPIVGTAAPDDLTITISFYGAEFDSNGDPVIAIDPANPDDTPALNSVSGVGTWPPSDPRDAGTSNNAIFNGECPTVCPGGDAPILQSLAVQKTVVIEVDNQPGGANSGDVLGYQLNFQISDFSTFANLSLDDLLSDGQTLYSLPGFEPNFSITEGANTFAGLFNANMTSSPNADGSTTLVFDITGALISAGDDGILQGGDVNGSSIPTTGTITYYALIDDNYTGPVAGDPSVDQGDLVGNAAVIQGNVQANGDPTGPAIDQETDDSSTETEIVSGSPMKSVYAVNGQPCGTCQNVTVSAGDTVTYQIGQSLPTSDFDNFALTEYLPLPVFDATTISTVFDATVSATPPPVGMATFGPNDTLFALSGIVPVISTSSIDNAITFDWGSYDNLANTSSVIDVLFTVLVSDEPFADGLLLTNMVQSMEVNSQNQVTHQTATAPLTATAPILTMTKGVVASTGVQDFVPTPNGPVTFNPPGSATPFSGTINSLNLDAAPINSDLGSIQPGDILTFAVVIENLGTSPGGAFDIQVQDLLPAGFVIPPGGINLQITTGNGLNVSYIPLGGGGETDLFGPGIELVDPGTGACGPYSDLDGTNIVVITYELQVDSAASGTLENMAELVNYASQEQGADFNGDQNDTESALAWFRVGVSGVVISKQANPLLAQPGEAVSWSIQVSNPTDVSEFNVSVVDAVPDSLLIVSATATRGDVQVNGQTVSWSVTELLPGETITITIQSQVRDSETPPYVIVNGAVLLVNNVELGRAEAKISSAGTLPGTGEMPLWAGRVRMALMLLMLGIGLAGIALRHRVRKRI